MKKSIQFSAVPILLTILLTTGCGASQSALPPMSPFRTAIESGDQHLANGARTDAEAAYLFASSLRPDNPTPYLRLASLYQGWNRPEEGMQALALAETQGAPPAAVLPLRVTLHTMMGNWESVIVESESNLGITPAATLRQIAEAYVARGQITEAIAAYETLLSDDRADRKSRERLGALLAIVDPPAARPHLNTASTPLAADLAVALEGDDGADPAYRLARVGQTLVNHEEWHLAALALTRAVALNPAYASANALLGHTLDQLDRSQEALSYLEAAVQQAPESYLSRSLLGLHYLQSGELRAARPHLETAYELDPENPAIALYLGHLYADLGYVGAANIWLEEAIRLAPDAPSVAEAVIRFYLSRGLGEKERTLEAARLLVEQTPARAISYDLLGWSQLLFGELEEAEENLRYAITLDPTLASAHYHLGQLAATSGDFQAAQTALRRAIDLNTDPILRAEIEQAIEALSQN